MEDSQPSLSRQRLDLVHAGNSTTPTIPFDLIIEILSLLPVKSLLRFQSVSKLWFATIRSKTFVDSFLTRSKARPRLLFTLSPRDSQKKFILSVPEHTDNNKDDDKTSRVMARYGMTISDVDVCGSVNGFVCVIGKDCNTISVYNPTTRQIVNLPEVTTNRKYMVARIGYDPVEDQYKVLCVTLLTPKRQNIQQEHFVCTVSSSHGEQEWRKIENPTGDDYHYVFFGQTCIDGALYYAVGPQSRIVRFDVRSEKIDFIKRPEESYISATSRSIFTNYKGKLGGIKYSSTENLLTLWVLEDAEKHGWSSMTFALSSKLEDLIAANVVSQVVIHTGELMVFRPWLESSKPFYVCYYDFNKESRRKVKIRVMKGGDFRRKHGNHDILCYAGHIENIIRFL